MVDILLTVHNGEEYLNELITSILDNSYKDIRIIAGDDASSDTSRDVLNDYKRRYPDKFELHFFDYEKSSAKENFLRLLRYSRAEYVMFADQDDVWLSDKIEICVKKADEYSDTVPLLLHTDLTVVDSELNILFPCMSAVQKLPVKETRLNRLLVQNNITGCTVLINRALADMVRTDNIDNIIMHDWWFGLIAAAFGRIIFIDRATILYRQHDLNEIGAKDVASTDYINSRLQNTADVKKNMHDTYIQAKEFLSLYNDKLKNEQTNCIRAYAECADGMSKMRKLKRFAKYGFWKNTLVRKIGQMIWG